MLLANKRMVLRNQADFEKSFLCTNRDVPYGIWINVGEAKEKGREATLREIDEILVRLV